MMKKPNVFVLVGITLLIGLTWLSLVPLHAAQLSALAPIVVIPLLVLGSLPLLRRGAPARSASGGRAWLGYALVFSAAWLLFLVGRQWVEMFVPSTGIHALTDPAPSLIIVTILGLPAVFGALGLISGYTGGRARAGV